MAQRLLIADDDNEIIELLEFDLSHSGYEVDCAKNGEEALQKALVGNYDLVLLDVMMPKMNGFDVCNNIRKAKLEVPILMLTAKGTIADKTQGFDMGADDYIVKPFDIQEVLLRVRALVRRSPATKMQTSKQEILKIGDIELFPDSLETIVKNLSANKSPRPDGFTDEFSQTFREELTIILLKLLNNCIKMKIPKLIL